MGPAPRGRLAVVAAALVAAACTPIGPREVTGGAAGAKEKGALELLAQPGAPRLVAAERAGQGSRLVLIDEHGATIRPLTDEPVDGSIDVTPTWSPDGEWILFASSRGRASTGELSLWVVPVFAQGGARRLTDPSTVDITPAWGADGRIAWASTRGGAGFDIWTADLALDGNGPHLKDPRRMTRSEDEDTMPAPGWSLLVWTRHHAGTATLVSWDEKHGKETLVAGLPAGVPVSWPAFAQRTGIGMAYVERSSRGDTDLVFTPGTSRPKTIESSLGDESAPHFAAGGRFLFATSVARTPDGNALWSSIVFADLSEDPPRLRALYDKDPKPRLGVDVAPVPLDTDVLLQAPEYREGLKQVLSALGLQPE